MEFFEKEVKLEEIKQKLLIELYNTFIESGISKITLIEDFEVYQHFSKHVIVSGLKELVSEGFVTAWPLCNGYNITKEGIKTIKKCNPNPDLEIDSLP